MVAHKWKKKNKDDGKSFFAFLIAYLPKTQLIKALNSLDSSRTYRTLLESPKPGSSRELILPESGFKTCYTVYFSKKNPDFGGLETNGRYETQTSIFFKCPST